MTADTPPPEPDALAAEIAALAAEGPHLVASWSARGAVHRSCSCGVSTPPAGVLTAATAEGFVAKCRAAQDEREAARDRAAQRTTAGATPAAPAPADPGAGTDTPGPAETISAPPIEVARQLITEAVHLAVMGERAPGAGPWPAETWPDWVERARVWLDGPA